MPLDNGERLTLAKMNMSLFDLPGNISGRHPQSLDANLAAIILSVKYVRKPTGGSVILVGFEFIDQ